MKSDKNYQIKAMNSCPLLLSLPRLSLPSLCLSLSPPSLSPEIRGEVSQMVSISDKIPVAVEKNKLLLPPYYNRYFMWGFPDYSARIATVEGDKVSSHVHVAIEIKLYHTKES